MYACAYAYDVYGVRKPKGRVLPHVSPRVRPPAALWRPPPPPPTPSSPRLRFDTNIPLSRSTVPKYRAVPTVRGIRWSRPTRRRRRAGTYSPRDRRAARPIRDSPAPSRASCYYLKFDTVSSRPEIITIPYTRSVRKVPGQMALRLNLHNTVTFQIVKQTHSPRTCGHLKQYPK